MKYLLSDEEYYTAIYDQIYRNYTKKYKTTSKCGYDREHIKSSLFLLTERQQIILELRYRFGKTQKEIGEMLGLSDSRISYIESMAFRKFRNPRERNRCIL